MIAYFVKITYFMLVIICVVYMSLWLVYGEDELDSVVRDFFYEEPVVRRGIRVYDEVGDRLNFNTKMLNPGIKEDELLMNNPGRYRGYDTANPEMNSIGNKLENIQFTHINIRAGTVGVQSKRDLVAIKIRPLVIKEDREFYILKYVFGIPSEGQETGIKIRPLVIK